MTSPRRAPSQPGEGWGLKQRRGPPGLLRRRGGDGSSTLAPGGQLHAGSEPCTPAAKSRISTNRGPFTSSFPWDGVGAGGAEGPDVSPARFLASGLERKPGGHSSQHAPHAPPSAPPPPVHR